MRSRAHRYRAFPTDETLVEISSDCICCTLRYDLLDVTRRGGEGRFDYPLVEPTSISVSLRSARSVPVTARRRTAGGVGCDPAGSPTEAAVDAADELPRFFNQIVLP